MHLKLSRTNAALDSTLGELSIDGVLQCYTLEDELRDVKVPGETAIAAGVYQIMPRVEGTLHLRYLARYPDIHVGMAWLQDVPEFTYVYIHTGNTDDDTDGCILVGTDYIQVDPAGNHSVINSRVAYKALYEKIADAWAHSETVLLSIEDL